MGGRWVKRLEEKKQGKDGRGVEKEDYQREEENFLSVPSMWFPFKMWAAY